MFGEYVDRKSAQFIINQIMLVIPLGFKIRDVGFAIASA